MAAHTDGIILIGGFTITLDIAGTTHVVNTASITRPTKRIQITDANDAPTAAYTYDDWVTGSANIEINATGQHGDVRGDTFTTSAFTNVSQKFVITEVGEPNNKGANITYDIDFTEVIN